MSGLCEKTAVVFEGNGIKNGCLKQPLSTLIANAFKDEGSIDATKSKVIAHHVINIHLAASTSNVIQITTIWV